MEPKYKIGDTIQNIHGHKGEIFNVQFSEISNEWIYHIRIQEDMYPNSNLASIKESNVFSPIPDIETNRLDNGVKTKKK